MKRVDAEAGGRKSLPSWASRLASASAMAALLLLMGSAAKADVVPETFDVSGSLNTSLYPQAPLVPFMGKINVDFTNNFADDTVTSIQITVQGRPVFKLSPSLNLASSAIGLIGASNSSGDTLSLTFTTLNPGTWSGFNNGSIVDGEVIFGGLTGVLLGAEGVITRELSNPPIPDPLPSQNPPPSATVPELSTWTMMLVGLAGLGLAAKGRRALAFLGGRA